MLRCAVVILSAAASISVSGCSDYVKRRDTIWLGAGEAVETNIVTQEYDPWPVGARSVRIASDGERAQHAVERYRNPHSGAGTGGNTALQTAPGGSPPPKGP